MDLGAAGLLSQPFPSQGEPPASVAYTSQREALKAIKDAHEAINGLCLLQGPALSGKSTVIRNYVASLPDEAAVAVVDARQMNTTGLLQEVLRQFGYVLDHGSASELLAMLRVFSMQQTVSQQPPLLVIENTQDLNPGALRALCDLAALKVRHFSAMKMVLASNRSLQPILETPPMEPIRRRVTRDFHLRPMTRAEAREYLHLKILVAGCNKPNTVFPDPICEELWRASGGWPGILDRVALLSISKAVSLPVSADVIEMPILPQGTWTDQAQQERATEVKKRSEPPRLYVTLDGNVQHETALKDNARLLIGRSEYNDVALSSKFISRHHALLVRTGQATLVMDLNSTNGVFVNSKRVTNQFLVNDDVISIGNYRIKFVDPTATQRELMDNDQFAETTIMKTLDDMRNLLAQDEAPEPHQSENLPTASS